MPCKIHFMSGNQHGAAFLGQLLHDAEHFSHKFRVQGRSGLVHQQGGRLHGQCAGDGCALLLAAGELGREIPGLVVDADFF